MSPTLSGARSMQECSGKSYGSAMMNTRLTVPCVLHILVTYVPQQIKACLSASVKVWAVQHQEQFRSVSSMAPGHALAWPSISFLALTHQQCMLCKLHYTLLLITGSKFAAAELVVL